MCKGAASAAPLSKWRRAVRIGPGGLVLEPASGAFDVTVAPGEDLGAAVGRCPSGGSVLLLPGTHEGQLKLGRDTRVHVFGRGLVTITPPVCDVIDSQADSSTVDGILQGGRTGDGGGVRISLGRLRLQACDVGHTLVDSDASPTIFGCR